MVMNECWIVRKGEDAWKVAGEIANAILNRPDSNPKCLFCGEDHWSAAIMGWRDRDAVMTAGICAHCAELSDEPRKFSGWLASHFSPRH
jgi:hypothetical protein